MVAVSRILDPLPKCGQFKGLSRARKTQWPLEDWAEANEGFATFDSDEEINLLKVEAEEQSVEVVKCRASQASGKAKRLIMAVAEDQPIEVSSKEATCQDDLVQNLLEKFKR